MNNKLSTLEMGILSSYLIKAFILINGINILISIDGSDSIVSVILGFILSLFLIKIIDINKSNITSLNKLPSMISLIIKLLLVMTLLFISSYLLYTVSLFTKDSILNNMNISYISVLFFILVVYTSNKGITTIVRSSLISFFILIIIEVISLVLSLPNINSLNILPILTSSTFNILKSSSLYVLLSISPLFLLLSIDEDKIYTTNKNNKYITIFFIGTHLYIIFNLIMVLSIINYKFVNIIDYPEVFVLSKISILNFFDRMEVLLSFKFILDIFFTLSLSLYYINKLVKITFKNKSNVNIIKYILIIAIIFLCNLFKFTTKLIITTLIIFDLISIIIIFLSVYLNNQKDKKIL